VTLPETFCPSSQFFARRFNDDKFERDKTASETCIIS